MEEDMHPIVVVAIGSSLVAAAVWMARGRCRGRRSRGAGMVAAIAIGIATAVFARRDPVPALDANVLAAARARWDASAVHDYDLVLDVHADGLEDARYEVVVRGDRVTRTTRDGGATRNAEDSWSVPAFFAMLERELELAHDPPRGFGAPSGYRAYLSAAFDPRHGVPRRYRRVVGGTNRGVEIRVVRFAIPP
jgi:hypothetical protein